MEIPHVPLELIETLKRLYPMRMPKVDEPERQIFVRVGHQEVIRTLENFYQQSTR